MRNILYRFRNQAALALILMIYLLVLAGMPGNVFWSPDEGIKFIMVKMLAGNGPGYALPYQAASVDPEFHFYPSNNPYPDPHNNYPYRAPDGSIAWPWHIWFPLLARVPFLLFGSSGIYLVPLLSAWLAAVFVWRITRQLRPGLAPGAALVAGLGTPLFFYAVTFWEHTLAAFLAMMALCIGVLYPRRSLALLVCIPILLGAIVLRIEMLAFAVAFILGWVILDVATLFDSRSQPGAPVAILPTWPGLHRRWLTVLGLVAGLGILALNWTALVTPRHQSDALVYAQVLADNGARLDQSPDLIARYAVHLPDLIVNYAGKDGPALDGVWLWIGLLAFGLCTLSCFLPLRIEPFLLLPSLALLLVLSLDALVSRQNYTALHGLVLPAPFIVIALQVLPLAWRRREWPLVFLAAVAVLYLAIGLAMLLATRVAWDDSLTTGLEWGPRYLLPLYPVLAILSVIALDSYYRSDRPVYLRRIVAGVVLAMMVIGLQFQVRGLWMLYTQKQAIARWQDALETQARGPVVTNVWWLPASVAPYFVAHPMLVVHPENTSEWFQRMEAQGIRTFTLATQVPLDGSKLPAGIQINVENVLDLPGMRFTQVRIDSAGPYAAGSKGN